MAIFDDYFRSDAPMKILLEHSSKNEILSKFGLPPLPIALSGSLESNLEMEQSVG